MGENEGHVEILGPRKMQLHIVVKLGWEARISLLNRIGVHVGSEGIEHPIRRTFDSPRVGSRNRYRLLQLTQRFGRVADIGSRERVKIGLADGRVQAVIFPVAVGERIFAAEAEFD